MQINKNKADDSGGKWAKHINSNFTEAFKCSINLLKFPRLFSPLEMSIKVTMRYYYTQTNMAKIKKENR